MNETELIALLKEGDAGAFKYIVDQWKDMVYNTSLGIVQHSEEAADVSQDVFVQVFESVGQFKGDAKFSTWLYRIAVTKSLDHLRKKKRKKRFAYVQSLFGLNEEEVPTIADNRFFHPGVVLEQKENAAILMNAISQLPENQKSAFVLHKMEGLSYLEVASVLECSLSSVESLMHRAKLNLKKILKEYYQNNQS